MKYDRKKLVDEHHEFNRTFLKECAVEVFFPKIENDGLGKLLSSFLKECYNIDDEECINKNALGKLVLNSNDSGMQFIYTNEKAKITVPHESYVSFTKSILPYTRPLVDFVEIVGQGDTFSNMIVSKKNVWQVFSQNPAIDIINGLNEIFRPERRADMPEIIVDDKQILSGISFETTPIINDCNYNVHLRVKVKGEKDNRMSFILDTKVEAGQPIKAEKMRETALEMNSVAYFLYIDLVSDYILDLMDQKE